MTETLELKSHIRDWIQRYFPSLTEKDQTVICEEAFSVLYNSTVKYYDENYNPNRKMKKRWRKKDE